MLIDAQRGCHLTYCSNIHPGESWPEVQTTLNERLPAVKRLLGWEGPMGVGLRLAAAAADTLSEASAFAQLQATLDEHGLYVFTINGFPYGPFHGTRVKEDVYLPDWRDPERLRYSNVLAELMARLMPDDGDAVGSISSVPGAFKARVTEPAHVAQMVDHLLAHVAVLVDLERRTGKRVVLALEPEPCCYLETVAESVAFFTDHLLAPGNLSNLAGRLNASVVQAEAFVRTHLGVCLDLCHAAVEFEDAATCVSAFEDAGIKIHKMQVSAGLRFDDVGAHTEALLEPFVDAVYLHQVVAQHQAGGLQRYVDLDEAFAALPNEPAGTQWRVHFHVPIFLDSMGQFSSTQSFIEEMLALHRRKPLSSHIEVETYTWNVLPERFRNMSVDAAVARELEWARARALPGLGEGLA